MDKMKECIQACWDCRAVCQEMLFNHCLSMGGEHVAESHVKLMTDCIQICQLAADFMTRQSEMHDKVCGACADICDSCADSCEEIGGEEMNRCMEACRKCAEECRHMRPGLWPRRNCLIPAPMPKKKLMPLTKIVPASGTLND
jgi:hypothetical protein